jgi:hypothetical protein
MKGLFVALLIVLGATVLAGKTGAHLGSGRADTARAPGSASTSKPRWGLRSGCTLVVNAPARDGSDGRVTGSARYTCDRPGADVDLTVYLQRRDGTSWRSVDQREAIATPKDSTRDRPDRQRTSTLDATCLDAVYRTFARGTATANGRTQQLEQASRLVTVVCHRTPG